MDKSSPTSKHNPFDTGDLRNYFRVTSAVRIRTVSCTDEQLKTNQWPKALSKSPSILLLESLKASEHDAAPLLRSIGEQNRHLEQYLRSMNKRIESIARYLNSHVDEEDTASEQEVLISEGGIEFKANNLTNFKMGDCLALEIVLTLSQAALSVFGRVINVRESSDKFLIGVEFLQVKDLDRQQLAKHVIQQQLTDKRDANKKGS